jgi:Ca2+-binding EF-hand superfamily protein
VSDKLRQIAIRKWLNTRYQKKTKVFYTKSKDELKEQFDAETIFFKFDDDCSGTLTIDELKEVFEFFKIDIDMGKIIEVFNILDCD